jgi:hypothetical protein
MKPHSLHWLFRFSYHQQLYLTPCARFSEELNNKGGPYLGGAKTNRSERRSLAVDLNTLIIAGFCLIDDRIKDIALRARGPLPNFWTRKSSP